MTTRTYNRVSRQDLEARAPKRVVAVVSAKKYASEHYVAATVYELTPRKDGVLVYRRSGEQAEPHRSERLALKDAQEIAGQLDIPLWAHVRHNMTVLDAMRGADDGDADDETDEAAKEAADEIAKEQADEAAKEAASDAYDEAYKAAYSDAYAEAIQPADEIAKEQADEAAKEVASDAYSDAYDEAYKAAYDEAYAEAIQSDDLTQ